MHRIFITLICCVTLNLTLWGQLARISPHGAISLGLGGISSIDTDEWAAFNNPAALTNLSKLSFSVGYQSSLNFTPFNSSLASVILPAKWGTGAIAISSFGDELFNLQTFGLAFGHKVGTMDFGLKANLIQISIDGFEKRMIPVFEFGGLIDLSTNVSLGTHVYNLSQSLLSLETQEKIPVILRLSLDYHPNGDLNIYTEIVKDILLQPEIKVGLAYKLVDRLVIRTGIAPNTKGHSFGFGLTLQHFRIDYAVRRNQSLVSQHSLGLTYKLNAK